ncbi:MAG: DUF4258 domain-containing protein [Senegalia sp. (in: firmicutes)]|uniref:DUF4258 domain-containing protein n=1 Tax=Senegalia sp. (in: firmicutes) TaxID=1924098 RepID=UPI003F969DE6
MELETLKKEFNNEKDYIIESTKRQSLYYSKHAIERMCQRGIEVEDVEGSTALGDPIEKQYHGKDIKFLFQQPKSENPRYYAVVALAIPPLVISVCHFKEDVWEMVDGIMRRKEEDGR